jgi:hypothetical protein
MANPRLVSVRARFFGSVGGISFIFIPLIP